MSKSKFDFRNLIALTVVFGGFAFVIFYICKYPNENSLNSILPVVATWVGTIIAFYFGKENFESASKSLQDVITKLTPEQKMENIKVKDVMLPVNKIEYEVFDTTTSDKPILEILNLKLFEKYQRLAFFDKNQVFKYMIHKSTFTAFLVDKYKNNVADLKSILFKELLEDKETKQKLEKSVKFVSINANLLEAKKSMDSIPECLDVFVTQTGVETEPVMGLITNNMILEHSRV